MRRLLLILALLLSASAWAQVPIASCTNTGSGSASCALAVTAHHLVTTTLMVSGSSTPLTYTDSLGNSFSQPALLACGVPGTPCNAGVGMMQAYSISFAAQTNILFYISTGSFSGTITFNVAGGPGGNRIIVDEYPQDLIGVEIVDQANPTITTTGANDLLIVFTGDTGVVTCATITPASGFTLEFSQLSSCRSLSDQNSVGPGTTSYRPTLTGTLAVPAYSAIAFGVGAAPPTGTGVRHRILQ